MHSRQMTCRDGNAVVYDFSIDVNCFLSSSSCSDCGVGFACGDASVKFAQLMPEDIGDNGNVTSCHVFVMQLWCVQKQTGGPDLGGPACSKPLPLHGCSRDFSDLVQPVGKPSETAE